MANQPAAGEINPEIDPEINPWIIAISVMLSTFMEVLDTTVVNVSLPHIAGSLSASVDEATWSLTSYLVATAINVPVGIASLVMTQLFIFDPPYIRRSSQRIDYWGIGMLAIGVACLQVVLDKGQEADWFAAHWITALAVTAFVALTALVIYELKTPHPAPGLP